jgi:hypothetical protein
MIAVVRFPNPVIGKLWLSLSSDRIKDSPHGLDEEDFDHVIRKGYVPTNLVSNADELMMVCCFSRDSVQGYTLPEGATSEGWFAVRLNALNETDPDILKHVAEHDPRIAELIEQNKAFFGQGAVDETKH